MFKSQTITFLFFLIILLSGCSTKKNVAPTVVYKERIKYIYLPCPNKGKQAATTTSKKRQKKAVAKKQKSLKFYMPKQTKIYVPKSFQTRPNKVMDFMVGINQDGTKFVYLEGEFGESTYQDFLRFLSETKTNTNEIKISSNGGLVKTAMQIGSYVYENRWKTGVDKEMHCFSACGFVYFAGREKSIQGAAKIGLHRPYTPGVTDTPQNIRAIKREYMSYWNYIHASKSVYDEMMEVGRDELFILDRDNINDYIDVSIK